MEENQDKLIVKSSTFRAISMIGDYWMLLLMRNALLGSTQYSEFFRGLDVTHQTLSNRLKRLVATGFLSKQANGDSGTGGEAYRLTPMGRDLLPVLLMTRNWQKKYLEDGSPGWIEGYFVHANCGLRAETLMACSVCREPILSDDIRPEPGPGSGFQKAPNTYVQRRVSSRSETKAGAATSHAGIVGDRWAATILAGTFRGFRKFAEFRDKLGISPRTLSQRLAMLVDAQMLRKQIYQSNPKRYEYTLTEKGQDFYPIIISLMNFGDKWLADDDGPPALLRHTPCGSLTVPQLRCDQCNGEVRLHELKFHADS